MIALGVDPGVRGAWAVYDNSNDDLIVEDFPVLAASTAKNRDDIDMHALLREWRSIAGAVDHAFIERVASRPKQGVASVFRFGYAAGEVYAALVSLELPVTFVTPQGWQKGVALRGGTGDQARARCMQLWPRMADSFKLVRHGHRADAALIAYHGSHLRLQAKAA